MKSIAIAAAAAIAVGAAFQPAHAQNIEAQEDEAVDKAIACRAIENDIARLACLDRAAESLAVTRIIREDESAAQAQAEKDDFGLAERQRDEQKDKKKKKKKDKSRDEEPAPTIAETPDDFGAEAIRERREERDARRLKSVTGKIVEVRINQFGKVTIALENGQIWRQLNSDDRTVRFPNIEDRLYTAKIKRSLMGNYMLTVNELKRTIRVRRVE